MMAAAIRKERLKIRKFMYFDTKENGVVYTDKIRL